MSRAASIIAVVHRWELHTPDMGSVVGSKVCLLAAATVLIPPAVRLQTTQQGGDKQAVLKDDYHQALF